MQSPQESNAESHSVPEYGNIIEFIPPLSSRAYISESETDSDRGSLCGYYDRLVKDNMLEDENLLFVRSDGRTASFAGSRSSQQRYKKNT